MIPGAQVAWGAATDRGLRRAVNEDSFIASPPLFLVADGMGGHAAGADASRSALDGFRSLIGLDSVTTTQVEDAFRAAVVSVDALDREDSRPGTTLAGAAVCEQDGEFYWLIINIGDSRVYRFSDGALTQISIDHSAVQAMVDRGELTASEAEHHPQRNIVTRAVGAGSSGVPDYWLIPAATGDRILICSDGLPKEVADEAIGQILAAEPAAQAAATRLVHEALLHGGRDNVTVVVVDTSAAASADDDPTLPAPEQGEETLPRAAQTTPTETEGHAHAHV